MRQGVYVVSHEAKCIPGEVRQDACLVRHGVYGEQG